MIKLGPETSKTLKSYPDWVEFKLLMAFPDAEIDDSAGKITLGVVDLLNMLNRLNSLEYGYPEDRPKAEKFPPYREGGWIQPEPW